MLNIILVQSLAISVILTIILGQSLAISVILTIILGQSLAISVIFNIILGQSLVIYVMLNIILVQSLAISVTLTIILEDSLTSENNGPPPLCVPVCRRVDRKRVSEPSRPRPVCRRSRQWTGSIVLTTPGIHPDGLCGSSQYPSV